MNAAARVLTGLAGTPFPAGRCASDPPVLPLGSGRHLLVTEYVEPAPAPGPGFLLAWCAGLLARLATRSARDLPSGGGWHRLGATPSHEIAGALRLGGQIGPSAGELAGTLAGADDGTGLPEALIHADLTPPNAVPRGDQPPVIIDWIGAGPWPAGVAAGLPAVRGGAARCSPRSGPLHPLDLAVRGRTAPAAGDADHPAAGSRPMAGRARTHDGAAVDHTPPCAPGPGRSGRCGPARSRPPVTIPASTRQVSRQPSHRRCFVNRTLNGNLADARPCPHRSVPYTRPGEDSLRGALSGTPSPPHQPVQNVRIRTGT